MNEHPTPSIHSLQLGLPGYLILFAPLAFDPQCQLQARNPPSPRVFFAISTHFTATPQIPISLPALKPISIKCNCTVEQYDFTSDLNGYLQSFTPSESGQRLPPLYYRGCWHRVSRSFFCKYRQTLWILTIMHLFLAKRSLQS